MGIPSFASRLRNYGSYEIIGRQVGDETRKLAIIDGPSLAHSVAASILHEGRADGAGISVRVSYININQAVVAWLRRLEKYGFDVAAIYFDGALPEYKRPVRVARLQNYVTSLVAFKELYDDISKARLSSKSPKSFAQSSRCDTARRKLGPPPFLVFAVVEALQNGDYATRTSVVDGEADAFCAAVATDLSREHADREIAIFTNDSDLIVYSLPDQTRVVQILEVEETRENAETFLRAFTIKTAALRKLEPFQDRPLPDLTKPAFEMLDPHITFRDALMRCASRRTSVEFDDFAKQYDICVPLAQLHCGNRQKEGNLSCLSRMDSRISEFVRRVTEQAALQMERPDILPTIDMYLPMLFEDPSRSSPWRIGMIFRFAAYTFIRQIIGVRAVICEYRRSGQRVAPYEMPEKSITELADEMQSRLAFIRQSSKCWSSMPEPERWRFVVMELISFDLSAENMSMPDAKDVVVVLNHGVEPTWTAVHLAAQHQATYYSLRMLKQILEAFSKLFPRSGIADVLPWSEDAREMLQALPNITEYSHGYGKEFRGSDGENRGEMTTVLLQRLGISKLSANEEESKSTKRKKRKVALSETDNRSHSDALVVAASSGVNPFAALAD